jgi:hypothetical protein
MENTGTIRNNAEILLQANKEFVPKINVYKHNLKMFKINVQENILI